MSLDPVEFHESIDPLEKRLGALQPAELPPDLEVRLQSARPRRLHWITWAAPLAAAAVWLVAFAMRPHGETENFTTGPDVSPSVEPSDLRVYLPIEERSTLVDVRELGVVNAAPDRPVRLMRYRWIDDTTFRGDDGRSTLRRTEPRDQIVPVVLETF